MSDRIQVVVIEREPVYRKGLIAVLGSATDINVAGSVETVEEAYQLADEIQPAVAVVGTTLTDAPGLELAAELRRRYPAVAIIVIAAHESDDELFAAIRAGASAYSGRDMSRLGCSISSGTIPLPKTPSPVCSRH